MTNPRLLIVPLDPTLVLRVIAARGCERTSVDGAGACFGNGLSPLARFGADAMCHGCLAWAALLPDSQGEHE